MQIHDKQCLKIPEFGLGHILNALSVMNQITQNTHFCSLHVINASGQQSISVYLKYICEASVYILQFKFKGNHEVAVNSGGGGGSGSSKISKSFLPVRILSSLANYRNTLIFTSTISPALFIIA